MSPTLLEITLAIVLLIVAWQIGVAVAPELLRRVRGLKRDLDAAADAALADDPAPPSSEDKEAHSHGTRHH